MHRTQILLEDDQYEQLKEEAARTGRSIGELVRTALDAQYGAAARRARLLAALEATAGTADPEDFDGLDGEEYVERIRPGIGHRMRRLGWG